MLRRRHVLVAFNEMVQQVFFLLVSLRIVFLDMLEVVSEILLIYPFLHRFYANCSFVVEFGANFVYVEVLELLHFA